MTTQQKRFALNKKKLVTRALNLTRENVPDMETIRYQGQLLATGGLLTVQQLRSSQAYKDLELGPTALKSIECKFKQLHRIHDHLE